MPAIRATNSRDIAVVNCSFYGFETDIELENVEGFVSKNNRFSKDNDPRVLLLELSEVIANSGLDKSSKERLARDVVAFLSRGAADSKEQESLEKRMKYIGDKAMNLFVQLVAAVVAGLIIK